MDRQHWTSTGRSMDHGLSGQTQAATTRSHRGQPRSAFPGSSWPPRASPRPWRLQNGALPGRHSTVDMKSRSPRAATRTPAVLFCGTNSNPLQRPHCIAWRRYSGLRYRARLAVVYPNSPIRVVEPDAPAKASKGRHYAQRTPARRQGAGIYTPARRRWNVLPC